MLAQLTSERIWSKLGAEHDAFYTVDSISTASGGGGLSTSLRDLARFGEMMRRGGFYNGRQIVSSRDQWWISHNESGVYAARGIHGQAVWIDPKAEMVIARYASHPIAANAFIDPVSLPAYAAMAKKLTGR